MNDLAEFLLARIAEDSSVAFFAQQDETLLGSLADHSVSEDDHRRTHAARWTPERVQAQCDAKRRLVEELARMERDEMGWDGIEDKVMRFLALPYVDHPDYDETWRP